MEKSAYELINSFDENLWKQGIEALLVEHTDEAAEALIALLADKTWRKREKTAKTLVEWGPELIPRLLTKMSPRNLDEMYWIFFVLGHFDNPAGRQRCIDYLGNMDPEVRGYAVRAMAICKSQQNARTLFPLLSDPNWAIRKLVFEKLLEFGKIILEDLRNALKKAGDEPTHPIVALFVKIGGAEVIGEMSAMYQAGSFAMRYSIVSALGELDQPNAVDFVIGALSDESWVIRQKAAEQLSRMGPKIFDKLSGWFGRGDSLMKHQIVGIIVDFLKEKSLPLLRRLLASQDQEYRILAVECLAKLPGDEPSRLLIKCLTDPFRIVSDYASECLAKKNNLNLELLLEHLATDDENLRFLVIKTIGNIGGTALNPIIRILEEGSKQERLFLLGVLQRITPNQKLIEVLVELLADVSWPVRNASANCLKAFGEVSVSHVVRVLNNPSEDIQFWSRRVLLSMGPAAVSALTQILEEGTDASIIPHIISALLAMDHSDAVPAVIRFLEKSDDNRISSVFEGIREIASREVVDTILNLFGHPDERIVGWLSQLLRKVKKPDLKRAVLLGLNLPAERGRFFVADAIGYWQALSENELKTVIRQLTVEKTKANVAAVFRILGKFPIPPVLTTIKDYLQVCDPDFMLDLMLLLAEGEKPQFNILLAELLRTRSEVIRLEDVDRVGKILGLIYKSRPEGILQGLSSPTMAFRLCCVVALNEIDDKRVALSLMESLSTREDPMVVKRAVKILSHYFFSEDFRLKGAVTDFLLNLGIIITDPLNEVIEDLENEIDRKAIIDLIESVGGTVDQTALRKKGDQKVVLSDAHLDEVLEKRKRAMDELVKYDKIIQTSHTLDLTIMFTDVKGYTAFSSKASLSEVMSMLKQHDEILIPVIEKQEGKVLKKIGDAFLVVFEHPHKALLAGIEIQRKLNEYNSTSVEERRLAVRIAINTGPVIRRENDVFGDAVNVTSRLEGVADAGEIIISASTFEKIDQTIFELTPAGEHQLKGIEKPVATYRVKW